MRYKLGKQKESEQFTVRKNNQNNIKSQIKETFQGMITFSNLAVKN